MSHYETNPVAIVTGISRGFGRAIPELVAAAYREASKDGAHGYLWHEFGDSALLLPA